jgi:hypothetical protein
MSGKAALIYVVGFGMILSIMAYRNQQVETLAIDNMANYVEWTNSHNVALAGTQVGLSLLSHSDSLRRRIDSLCNASDSPLALTTIAAGTFSSGVFAGASYTASVYGVDAADRILGLRSVSRYPVVKNGVADTLRDTVIVELERIRPDDFKILGLMMGFGGIGDDDWNSQDTMKGRIHINGRIKIFGTPVFYNKVTCSKGFSPPVGTSHPVLFDGYEEGVPQLALPVSTDLWNDLYPCRDSLTSPFTIPFSREMSLEFRGGIDTLREDGVVLARYGLHNYGRGVFYSTNRGDNWLMRDDSTKNGNITSLLRSGGTLFAGTLGGGVMKSTNWGTTWTTVNTGLTDTTIMALADSGTKIFAGTKGGGVFRSTNGGATWSAYNTGLINTNIRALARRNTNSAASDTFIYAGTAGGGVFKSGVRSAAWVASNTGLTNLNITALLIASPTTIFAGTVDSGVYRSTNNGITWSRIPMSGVTATGVTVTCLAIDFDTVVYAGTTTAGVYKSTLRGTLFTSSGLPNTSIRSLYTGRTDSNRTKVFAGTKGDGVFLTDNSGGSWTAVNTGLKNLDVTAFADSGTSATNSFTGITYFSLLKFAAGTNTDTLYINNDTYFLNGVIFSSANLSLKGTVDTKARSAYTIGMTIGSSDQIFIDGDLQYEWDPRLDTNSNDMLGVVAMNGIEIYNHPNNAPNDYATKTVWTVHGVFCNLDNGKNETFRSTYDGGNPNNFVGKIKTLGGIITLRPLAISKTSMANFYGYHRYFEWDNRLASNKKPPCFPAPDNLTVKSQLQVLNWWENVRFPKQ